jgi:hypothetical protein
LLRVYRNILLSMTTRIIIWPFIAIMGSRIWRRSAKAICWSSNCTTMLYFSTCPVVVSL